MTVDYSSIDPEDIAKLIEWMDYGPGPELPQVDVELLMSFSRYLMWRFGNHEEQMAEWNASNNHDMVMVSSNPDMALLSTIVGVLVAAYRLGTGAEIDDSFHKLDSFDDFIETLPLD